MQTDNANLQGRPVTAPFSNTCMWLFVFFPLIHALLIIIAMAIHPGLLVVAFLAICILPVYLFRRDRSGLRKAGYTNLPYWTWFFFPPGYMWLRFKLTGFGLNLFWVQAALTVALLCLGVYIQSNPPVTKKRVAQTVQDQVTAVIEPSEKDEAVQVQETSHEPEPVLAIPEVAFSPEPTVDNEVTPLPPAITFSCKVDVVKNGIRKHYQDTTQHWESAISDYGGWFSWDMPHGNRGNSTGQTFWGVISQNEDIEPFYDNVMDRKAVEPNGSVVDEIRIDNVQDADEFHKMVFARRVKTNGVREYYITDLTNKTAWFFTDCRQELQ